MDNCLTTWLTMHQKSEKLTSSEVTYDRFIYDPFYSPMYLDNDIGIFKQLDPKMARDWSKKILINLFRHDIQTRFNYKPDILDIGSGTGYPAFYLCDLGHTIYSVDYSAELQKKAQKNREEFNVSNVDIINAKCEHLPFADNSFDCIVMSHFLEFSFDPDASLNELSRVLKPNGYVIGLTSNWKQAVGRLFGHLNRTEILYPMLRAEVKLIRGEALLKYRVCTLFPHYEKTYYIKLKESRYLENLAKIINSGYLKLAIEVIERIGVEYIQYAICRQYDEDSLVEIYAKHGFEFEVMHGVRVPIQHFIRSLLSDNDFDFSFFEQHFDTLSKHMMELTRSVSPYLGFDMYFVAKNRKEVIS